MGDLGLCGLVVAHAVQFLEELPLHIALHLLVLLWQLGQNLPRIEGDVSTDLKTTSDGAGIIFLQELFQKGREH